jgi:alpha-L-fucosidase
MREIGAWMKINSEAIYNTRPITPYKEGKICFTSLSDGTVYAIYLADEDETEPPAKVWLTGFTPKPGTKLSLVGNNTPLAWERIGKGVLIDIPEAVRKKAPGKYAWTIKIAKS